MKRSSKRIAEKKNVEERKKTINKDDYAEFLATYDPNKDDLSEVTSKETTESQKREVKTSVFEQDSNRVRVILDYFN
ncbi:hypothetical protein L195_g017008 [Trifolium pratense]|uniref:Uncharacterized protein n=1 Tax=Trifolium pratense TaxID=57577 RepID=A0A2K3MSW8_TRIPR|nr:hypothetical protein L195_g017008 [Trifolium pratense]